MNFLEFAENVITEAPGKIRSIKTTNGYHKALWMQGRDCGLKRARQAVRHNTNEALPHLKTAPQAIRKDLGVDAELWLAGYEAAIGHVEKKINVFFFMATNGQILATK